jgi:predicted HicB family RNase H-like nuclease
MKNILDIDGQKTVVSFDPDIGLLRGEFLGLSGGAGFYASDVEGLVKEGKISLKVYLEMCAEKGVEPYRQFSGRFNVRLEPEVHAAAVVAAAAEDKSLNQWIAEKITEAAKAA